jgi:hypothetical protein
MGILKKISWDASAFHQHFGATLESFAEILRRVTELMAQRNQSTRNVGRPRKLCTRQALAMTLRWQRDATCLRTLAAEYGVSISTARRNALEIEVLLDEAVAVHEDGPTPEIACVTIDATETQIQRPKTGQKKYYSGKKKCHTAKTTAVTDLATGQIVAVSQTVPGSIHDFAAYKQMAPLSPNTFILADSGYQGIEKLHAHSWVPEKKPKNSKLDVISSFSNRILAKFRVGAEHIFAKIKAFKILDHKYRNRLSRYNRTFRIVAGLVNMDMARPTALQRWQESIHRRCEDSMKLFREADEFAEAALGAA